MVENKDNQISKQALQKQTVFNVFQMYQMKYPLKHTQREASDDINKIKITNPDKEIMSITNKSKESLKACNR